MEEQFFELPENEVGEMTFDEANKAINRMNHDQKNPGHPLNPTRQSIDPQKKAFMAYKNQLFEQRAATDETPTEYDVALNEEAVKKQQEIDDIHQAGLRDWNKLVTAGYRGADGEIQIPPEEISKAQARLFRMQVLNLEGGQSGLNELGNMISADMRKYSKTQELSSLFDTLMNTDLDGDLRQEIAHKIIGYLDALRRDSLAKKPTRKDKFATFKVKHNIQGDIYG